MQLNDGFRLSVWEKTIYILIEPACAAIIVFTSSRGIIQAAWHEGTLVHTTEEQFLINRSLCPNIKKTSCDQLRRLQLYLSPLFLWLNIFKMGKWNHACKKGKSNRDKGIKFLLPLISLNYCLDPGFQDLLNEKYIQIMGNNISSIKRSDANGISFAQLWDGYLQMIHLGDNSYGTGISFLEDDMIMRRNHIMVTGYVDSESKCGNCP